MNNFFFRGKWFNVTIYLFIYFYFFLYYSFFHIMIELVRKFLRQLGKQINHKILLFIHFFFSLFFSLIAFRSADFAVSKSYHHSLSFSFFFSYSVFLNRLLLLHVYYLPYVHKLHPLECYATDTCIHTCTYTFKPLTIFHFSNFTQIYVEI